MGEVDHSILSDLSEDKLVVVEWEDCTSINDWVDPKDLEDFKPRVFTVGWPLYQTEDSLHVVSSIGSQEGDLLDKVTNVMAIPKKMILGVEVVDVVSPLTLGKEE